MVLQFHYKTEHPGVLSEARLSEAILEEGVRREGCRAMHPLQQRHKQAPFPERARSPVRQPAGCITHIMLKEKISVIPQS